MDTRSKFVKPITRKNSRKNLPKKATAAEKKRVDKSYKNTVKSTKTTSSPTKTPEMFSKKEISEKKKEIIDLVNDMEEEKLIRLVILLDDLARNDNYRIAIQNTLYDLRKKYDPKLKN
jgi:hypothetical protein